MNKIYKCSSCNNVYSHRQSLWRHKQNCNNKRIRADTASYPDMEKQKTFIGAGNQQHSKTLNPDILALADSIVDEDHSPKKKKKTLPINELFPPRDDITDTDTDTDDNETEDSSDACSDDNESYSGI